MFRSFKRYDLRTRTYLILRCLFRPPFEPIKTWKTSFLLAIASTKRVSELHSLSFCVRHLRGWRSCTFSFLLDFVAKTWNPFVPDSNFKEFSVPSLDDFIVGDRDELLPCPIRALCKYLTRTEQCRPGIKGLFVSKGWHKNGCPITPFHFGYALWLPWLMHALWRRLVVLWGSEPTKSVICFLFYLILFYLRIINPFSSSPLSINLAEKRQALFSPAAKVFFRIALSKQLFMLTS